MIKKQHIFLTFLCILFLVLISPCASSYILYTVEDSRPTEFHANPDSLNRISKKHSNSILILMQNSLDRTELITLNIDLNNFEGAKRLIRAMSMDDTQLNNLIVNLNLGESDIRIFKDLNQENILSLNQLFNDVIRFTNLSKQELKYIEKNNITMLFHIARESEILADRIKNNSEKYYLRQNLMIERSNQFNLNITKYVQSIGIFENIVNETIIIQEARMRRIERMQQNNKEFSIPVEMPSIPIDLNLSNNAIADNITPRDTTPQGETNPILLFFVIGILFIFFISAAMYYLKYKKKKNKREIPSKREIVPFEDKLNGSTMEIIPNSKESEYKSNENTVKKSSYDKIQLNYHSLIKQNDFKQASNILYTYLKELCILKYEFKHYISLTPREFAVFLKNSIGDLNKSQINELNEFIKTYEEIYYGGMIPDISNKDMLFNYWTSIIKDIEKI